MNLVLAYRLLLNDLPVHRISLGHKFRWHKAYFMFQTQILNSLFLCYDRATLTGYLCSSLFSQKDDNLCVLFVKLQLTGGNHFPDVISDILKEKWDHEKLKFSLPPLMTLVSSANYYTL